MKVGKKSESLSLGASFDGVPLNIEQMYGWSVQLDWIQDAATPVVVASADIDDTTDTFNAPAHGLATGMRVQIATSGTLPAPLVALTDYWVIALDADSFQLAASLSDAMAGIPIDLTNAGVGNQTVSVNALDGTLKIQGTSDAAYLNEQYQVQNPDCIWSDITGANVALSGSDNELINATNQMYRYYRLVYTAVDGGGTLEVRHFYKGIV